MKMKTSTGRKIRYGSTSIVIVALVLASVIAINAIVTLLTQKFMWYGDMTPELKFTLSDECFDLIGEETDNDQNSPIEMLKKFRKENAEYNKKHPNAQKRDENVKINILFPVEKDVAKETDVYIYTNAEELREKFNGYITTEYVDAFRNPKRFEKYLSSNTETIDLNSVIIECGTEFRIRTFKSFYIYNNGQPYAYNAEKAFASSILAVTRSEAPLACYTTNHGEKFPTTTGYQNKGEVIPFLESLENAGYRTQAIDLSKDEIPEACRLLVTFNPKTDFIDGSNRLEKQGELKKLDAYLAKRQAFMVFLDPLAGELPVLEGFLDEWGLSVRRDTNGDPITVKDSANSVLNNSNAIISDYSKNDLMDGWAEDLSANVVFENAMVLEYAKDYDITYPKLASNPNKTFPLAYNNSYKPEGRQVFSMFNTRNTAIGYSNGVDIAHSTDQNPFMLMAVSTQTYTEQEKYSSVQDSAFVILCGSTDFASPKYLQSNAFGNENLLLTVFSMTGREPVPVGLDFKEFANFKIESVSTRAATIYTVVLTLVPIVIAFSAGAIVLVRRKNR